VTTDWDALAAAAPSDDDLERQRALSASQAIVAAQPPPAAAPAPAPSWADLAKDAPTTQELLADPGRAAEVYQDVEGLSFLETVFRGSGTMLTGGLGDAAYRGTLTDRLAILGWRQSQGIATPEEDAEAERLELLSSGLPRPEVGLLARGLRAATESTPMMVGSAIEAGPLAAGGAAVGAVVAGGAAALGTGGAAVGPAAIGGAKFGASVAGRAGMVLAMGKREAGLAFREYMAIPGVTREQARTASMIVGAVNGGLEVLPLDLVLQIPALKALVKGGIARDAFRRALQSNTGRAAFARAAARLAGGVTVEGLTEAAQELTTILGGQVIDQTEGVTIDWQRVIDAGVEGALAGAVMGAPGVAAGLRSDVREAQGARDRAAWAQGLAEAAAGSTTVAQNPDLAQAHVEAVQASQGGGVESVSVPAEALNVLFQQNEIALDQVARRMPSVARQLEEAAGNPGVEVAIPTAEFAVNVAPLKGFEALVKDLRVGDTLTLREAEAAVAESKKIAGEEAKREAKAPPATPRQRVTEDVAAKLEAAGQDPDVARTSAALWGAFADTMARRTGKGDAWAFYQELGLQLENEALGIVPVEEGIEVLTQPTAPVEIAQGEAGPVLTYPGQPLQLELEQGEDALRATLLALGVPENLENRRRVGGQGYSTALYLRALRLAQEQGKGFESDIIRTDPTERMYDRLRRLGVPFELQGERWTLSADALAELDLDGVERLMEAEAEIQRMRGEQASAQRLNQAGRSDVRGYVRFPKGREWFKVTLTGQANLSTFLHESGHVFLEALRISAEKNADLRADLEKVHAWLGVPASGDFTTDQLERFARGFETYLREGKAPAEGLAEVFQSFKAWLTHVYRTLRGLDVELTDEVRGVMDRLLATEAEIGQARVEAGLVPAFQTAEEAGMTPAEFAAYRAGWESAGRAAQTSVEQRSLEGLRRTLGEERVQVRADVQELALLDPVFNLREFLRTGQRLDGQAVDESIAGAKLSREGLEGLADARGLRRLTPFIAKEGGLDPDTLAPYFGFADGAAMVQALVTTPRRDAWVKAETDRRMAERYPEGQIATLGKMSVQAVREVEGMVTAMRRELDAAGKRIAAGPGRVSVEALRRGAKERVAQMTDLELRPDKYRRAEASSAKAFVEAVAAKKWAEAYDAKWRQLWNHFMAAETARAKEEVERIRAYARGFEDVGKLARIGKAGQRYVDAVRAILDGLQLRPESAKAVRRRDSLARYVAEMEASGDTVAPALKDLAELKSWRKMTVTELQGVEAALANVEAMARLKGKLLLGKERRDLVRTAAELAASIRANVGAEKGATPGQRPRGERIASWFRRGDAEMKKVEFLARELDGGKTAGLAHELLFQPMVDAQNARYDLQDAVFGSLMMPFQGLAAARRKRYRQTVGFLHSPKFGKMVRLTRRDVLSVVLNMGNDGNRERLLKGYGWTEEQVRARLAQLLDAGDVEIVENIWKTVDSLWPHIRDLHQRHAGLAPPRVEATPFRLVLSDGTEAQLSGGYYPIVKALDLSDVGRNVAEFEESQSLWTANFFGPVVEHGFTKRRGKDMSPLELSLDVVPRHLDKVIHYLTHYEPIRGVDRLLQVPELRQAITEGLGAEYLAGLRPWLQAIAADGTVHDPIAWWSRTLRHLRFGSSVVLLFGKIPTGIKQSLGLFTSAKEVRRRHLVSGVRKFLSEGWGEVMKESGEFRHLDKQLDRDARELFVSLQGKFGDLHKVRAQIIEWGALPIMLVQKMVNAVTWYAAREQAFEEGHTDPAAYADSVVRMTQTGGGVKDLAAIQRGGEAFKMLTVMFSYRSVLYNLLTERTGKSGWAKTREVFARTWWLLLAPVVFEQLVMSGIGDDEDEADVAKRLALEAALLPISTIPVAGDLGRGMLEDRALRAAPWLDAIARGLEGAKDIAAGDGKAADYRQLSAAVGTVTHLPTAGLWNLGEWAVRLSEGELEEPVQDLLFRNPSKWE
jgi:hypothetical protein